MAHQTHMIKAFLIAISLWLTTVPVLAQSVLETPATGEILQGWQRADGTRMAAIRIKLAPGWKTYWRSPGDAGIPPMFNWSGSGNLRGVGITWPAPQVYPQNGMNTIGYKNEVILPLTIAPRTSGKPVKLRAALDIGVCKDICVPFELKLKATLDNADTKPTPAIAAALAQRPLSGAEAGVRSATCHLTPKSDGFEITASLTLPSTGGREYVIIEPGQTGLWMSETDTTRRGATLTATGDLVPTGSGALALDRSKIVITVLGKTRAVEIKGCTPG